MAVDKLVDSSQLNSDLTSVANAIRTKGGTSASLAFPAGFVSAIGDIPTGGSSPLVSGTFTGQSTDKGSAITVNIPYTGSGYPICLLIYPSNGTNKSGDAFAELIQRYAEAVFVMVKNNITTAPTYNDTTSEANKAMVMAYYKSSASDATSITSGAALAKPFYRDNNAMEAYADCVRMKSNTAMSVYIANTSYGFADGIEYTYQIIYSS